MSCESVVVVVVVDSSSHKGNFVIFSSTRWSSFGCSLVLVLLLILVGSDATRWERELGGMLMMFGASTIWAAYSLDFF